MKEFIPRGRQWSFNKTSFITEPTEFEYVEPTYHLGDESQVRNSRYLIVSAPGAVGKSAFGLHLAATKNAMLWDLAKLRLGTNTFIGSVLQAIGPTNLPAFLASIASGETTLVFDSIDEAELHSGWTGVEDFLKDVIAYTANALPASVVFLARRDTAELLELALSDLAPAEDIATARIGFFSREGATQFTLAQISRLKGQDFVDRNGVVLREKAREAFAMPVVGDNGLETAADWRSTEHERFFGYAPVLQTIAKLLAESENPYTLSFKQSRSGYAAIVAEILELILNRERVKFTEAVAQRFASEKDLNLGELYSQADQQSRILGFVNLDEPDAYSLPATLKPQVTVQIDEMLRGFLPQHPFLDGKGFAGPAFRDYVLAKGLTSQERRFSSELWIESSQPLFTPILASLYHASSTGRAQAEDIELLYESANAGAVSGQSSLLLFVSEEDPALLTIEIAGDESNPLGEDLQFIAVNPAELTFARRLNNAQIVTSSIVAFGKKEQAFDFVDCEVSAALIRFQASRIRVRSENGSATRLESAQPIQALPAMKVEIQLPELLTIVAPNSKTYPWTPYSSDATGHKGKVDAKTTLHVMARILGWFRKDRRKEYGRYKDLIVKHVVGSSPTARYALGFIQHIGALSEGSNLYFIETEILDSYEVSWQRIRSGTVSAKATQAVEEYLRATPQPPLF
jgi:hypothetical protein